MIFFSEPSCFSRNYFWSLCVSVFGIVPLALFPLPATAQTSSHNDLLRIDTRLVLQHITEDNLALGMTSSDRTQQSLSEQLFLKASLHPVEDYEFLFHARALHTAGKTNYEDDTKTGASSNDGSQTFLELRELYLKKEALFGFEPVSIQAGRQRLKEPRALWWNSDQDLLRISYNTSLLNGFLAAGEDLRSYRNNTSNDFRLDDKDRFRTMGELSLQYHYGHFVDLRFLHENDHSGTVATQTRVKDNDRDLEDQSLLWTGIRMRGEPDHVLSPFFGQAVYAIDLLGLYGEETLQSVRRTGGVSRLSGTENRDVRAWGLDALFGFSPALVPPLKITLGYAFGSGDDGSGTDTAFRQTDLEGSSARQGLESLQRKYYGEVFRPELSNIHILSAALDYALTPSTSAGAAFYFYRLADKNGALRSDGLETGLEGESASLGQELDLFSTVDLNRQFPSFGGRLVSLPDLKIVGGAFFPGAAWETDNNNNAYRLTAELKFNF